MLIKTRLGELQKCVRLTEPNLKEFLIAAFTKFTKFGMHTHITEGVKVVDSSGTELDEDVFEDVVKDPSAGVLTIKYETEFVSIVESPEESQPSSSDSQETLILSESPSAKRQRLDTEAKHLVESILNNKPDGERIMKEYNRSKCLTDETRRKMVNILAADMTEKNGTSPPREVKEMYARGIVSLFPYLRDPFSRNGYHLLKKHRVNMDLEDQLLDGRPSLFQRLS